MSAAITFPIASKESPHEIPITIEKPGQQNISKAPHLKEDMPPTRRHEDDDFTLRESMNILALSNASMCKALEAQMAKTDTGLVKRVPWLMASFAIIALMGTGASFLTSSGVMLGGKQQEINQTQKDLQRLQTDFDKMEVRAEKSELRLREYEVWLQTTREKLADKGWKLPPLPKGE